MREKIEVYVERCRDDVILPTYANKYDAGMDIRSCVDITIKPNETVIVPTGLKFAIPEGYEIQVRPAPVCRTKLHSEFQTHPVQLMQAIGMKLALLSQTYRKQKLLK